MEIKSRFKTYRVEFVESLSLLGELAAEDDTFFVIDRAVYERYREQLPAGSAGRLFLMEAAEEHKTIATALAICEQMTAMPAKRNTHLVSIGGGIVRAFTAAFAGRSCRRRFSRRVTAASAGNRRSTTRALRICSARSIRRIRFIFISRSFAVFLRATTAAAWEKL